MRVGSLVECINNSGDFGDYIRPELNKIYTARSFRKSTVRKRPLIYLEEIFNKKHPELKTEMGYSVDRFRELMPPVEISIEQFNLQEA